MNGLGHLILIIAAACFPFVMMLILWRRMKRVRQQTYEGRRPDRTGERWEEAVNARDGLVLKRQRDDSDDLRELGDRGRHSRWPLDTQ